MNPQRIILPASAVPVGATVSKLGEPAQYTLMDHKPAYEFGSHKRDRIEIDAGHRLLAINVQFGLGDIIPANLDLIWYRDDN